MRAIFVSNNYTEDTRLIKGLNALKKNVDEVFFVGPKNTDKRLLLNRATWRLGVPFDEHNINKWLILKCKEIKPDLVFVVKGNYLFPRTLRKINKEGIKLVSYSLDDMYLKRNHSLYFKYGIKYYDLVVTTKKFNINRNEFPKWGARNILFQYQGYDEDIHRPVENCDDCKYAHDVIFVGSYEYERHKYLEYLADNEIKIHIYSPGWKDKINNKKFLIVNNHHLYLEEFACALSCSKIALNFLRKVNRDLHTSRSIEIPACGGFMLAERTSEHLELFEEGSEAEYFSSEEELLNKIKYYLSHQEKIKTIKNAALLRCKKSMYSYTENIREIIDYIKNI